MTETISKDSILFKVQLKNMVNAAIKELTDPKNRPIVKKAALSTIILYIAIVGMGTALSMIHEGIQLLIDSGVSEILIHRITGVGLWITGILTFVMFAFWFAWAMNKKVFNVQTREKT